MNDILKGGLAEATGTFALTFIGAAVLCTDSYSAGAVGLLGVAMAHGLVLAAVVTTFGRISGAHVNPAVTFGALLVGAIPPMRAAVWIAAQLLGAIIAGLMLTAVFAADVWEPVRLGAPMLGAGVQPGTAVFIEAALTFLLVLVMLGAAFDERAPRGVGGFAAGATLAAAMLVAGPLTGGALNPARALGPQFAAGYWEGWHVYWIGPALGAVLAAAVYGASGPWWRHDQTEPPDGEGEERW